MKQKPAEDTDDSSSGDEGGQAPTGSNAGTADPGAAIAEAFAKGMEALFRNIISNGASTTTKQSPRRKKTEDHVIQLEKATEPSQHHDFILVSF